MLKLWHRLVISHNESLLSYDPITHLHVFRTRILTRPCGQPANRKYIGGECKKSSPYPSLRSESWLEMTSKSVRGTPWSCWTQSADKSVQNNVPYYKWACAVCMVPGYNDDGGRRCRLEIIHWKRSTAQKSSVRSPQHLWILAMVWCLKQKANPARLIDRLDIRGDCITMSFVDGRVLCLRFDFRERLGWRFRSKNDIQTSGSGSGT